MDEWQTIKATPDRLRRMAGAGYLDAPTLERALRMMGTLPGRARWSWFIDYLLLILGMALLVTGIFFFFAYNWNGLNRFAKLGLLEALVILSTWAAVRMRLQGHPARLALTAAALLAGGLLAVYGQVYQTGADSYRLFAAWTVLITGWAAAGQYTLLWFIWLVLANISVGLYWNQQIAKELDWPYLSLALSLLNGLGLAAWEVGKRRLSWLVSRWTPRLVALALIILLTAPALVWTVATHIGTAIRPSLALTVAIYLLAMALFLFSYSRWQHDLFMLTIGLFSLVTCLCTAIFIRLDFARAGNWLLAGVILILLSAAAVGLLRRISSSWEENA